MESVTRIVRLMTIDKVVILSLSQHLIPLSANPLCFNIQDLSDKKRSYLANDLAVMTLRCLYLEL